MKGRLACLLLPLNAAMAFIRTPAPGGQAIWGAVGTRRSVDPAPARAHGLLWFFSLNRATASGLPGATAMRSTASPSATHLSEKFDSVLGELLAADDLQAVAENNVDTFDYDFMRRLMERVQSSRQPEEVDRLNRIGEAINLALQKQLVKADELLRKILKSGDLRLMEATLRKHLKAGDVGMAFDVVLNYNIQQAKASEDAETAQRLLQHLSSVLSDERDKRLPIEVRVLRMLLRTECDGARKRMLLDKLILPEPYRESIQGGEAAAAEETYWGPAEVKPEELVGAIDDFVGQLKEMAVDLDTDIISRAVSLRETIDQIVQESKQT